MKVVYVAHQLGSGADRDANRASASEWTGWIARTFNVAVSCDWIVLSGQWPETPENRALGIATDLEMVSRADEVWCVGPRMSPGMETEAEHGRRLGKRVYDFTGVTALGIVTVLDFARDFLASKGATVAL
jgi:hypothetical protein